MLNPFKFLKNLVKSSNQIELDRLKAKLVLINNFEGEMLKLGNDDFINKSNHIKDKIRKGYKLDDALPEAFALIREASHRIRNERHFDVQIILIVWF